MSKRRIKKIIEKAFNIEISRPILNSEGKKSYIINEAINLEKEVIFIAIPKTGSTSVRTQLKQVGTPLIGNPHLNIVQIRDLIYPYLLKQNLGTNTQFPNVDLVSDMDLRHKSEDIFTSFFKFAAVRNPWARAVSLYFRREGVQTNARMSFEVFCENHIYASDTCRQPTLHQNQYDWLASTKGELLMDYIYKVEDFEQAIDEIKKRTNGRVILENVRRNSNPNSMSENYRDQYTDKTKKIIEKRFEKDIDYFKYTF